MAKDCLIRPGVFLDRDGVLVANQWRGARAVAVRIIRGMELLANAREALGRPQMTGLPLAFVTNQPDFSTGDIDALNLQKMHDWLREQLPVDAIKTYTHVDADGCDCRKPKAGLLREAAAELKMDVPRSFMIGDRWRDVAAGAAVGYRTIFVGDGCGENFPVAPDYVAADVAGAVTTVL